MKDAIAIFVAVLFQVAFAPLIFAQSISNPDRQSILLQPALPRLADELSIVNPPSARVRGEPGSFEITDRSCPVHPLSQARRRIVDISLQEWAFFGFQVEKQSTEDAGIDFRGRIAPWRMGLHPEEVAQVAATVAGYWAASPDSAWLLNRQNEIWQREEGMARRWRDPWSAAFISWVMCESGLTEVQFARAVAHHIYIDQAISARDEADASAAYHAYEPGETVIAPGDMLCSGLRPRYRSLAERRAHLGEGARTHCDIVVRVDEENGTILTIGGNVRASVRMKVFPAAANARTGHLEPLETRRIIFAHLKLLGSEPLADALFSSPVLQHAACTLPSTPVTFADAGLTLPDKTGC